MTVFIAHADADAAAAADLVKFLKSHGHLAETETGVRGFRHLQRSDAVVALWSGKSVFSTHRMVMEKRILDAWSDQQLVLVKLDHGILPVGVRDLPAVDASFEQSRALTAWPQVDRAVRDAMKASMMEAQKASDRSKGPGDGSSGGPKPASPERRAQSADNAEPKGGGLFGGLFRKKAAASAPASRAEPEREAAQAPAPAPGSAAPSSVLFISYAHADDAAVTPIVAVVEANGRAVWIDKGGIAAGEGWAGEIVRGIKGSHGVIVMCSPRAFESDHIKREVYLADRFKKPMLPVFLEAANMPEDFEYFFAGVQWLELFKLSEAERAGAISNALRRI